jgi:hypothetical protein
MYKVFFKGFVIITFIAGNCFVVKVYHSLVYRPLPAGSVTFTHTSYVIEDARLDNASVFVQLIASDPLFVCPLVHCIVHEKIFPSGSLIGILQVKLRELFVEPLLGVGVPKTGG